MSLVSMNSFAASNPVSLDDMRVALATQSAVVIDIREPSEHATGVAKGAKLIPMSTLAARLGELPTSNTPLFIVCNTQNRSSRVVEQLQRMGYPNAQYVDGGMSLWARRGWEMAAPSSQN